MVSDTCQYPTERDLEKGAVYANLFKSRQPYLGDVGLTEFYFGGALGRNDD